MKCFSLCILLVCNCIILFSQGVKIGSAPGDPDPSSILEVESNSQGFLPPRMTTTERNSITSPAEGLLIYNTTTQCYEGWNQSAALWVAFGCICPPPTALALPANDVTHSGFTANWAPTSSVETYYFDLATDPSFTSLVEGYSNAEISGNQFSLAVNALTCGTAYYYRIRAENGCGTGAYSSTITASTSTCWDGISNHPFNSWSHRIKFTSQNAKVAASFPWAMIYDAGIHIADNDFWNTVQISGDDIRITQADGFTELPRGIREFDANSQKGLIYLKAEGISTSIDTDFCIYFGNSNAPGYADNAPMGMQNVFSVNHRFYSTMTDLTASTIKDETSHNLNGTKFSSAQPAVAPGVIGQAQSFDGTDDFIDLPQGTTTTNPWGITDRFTLSSIVHVSVFSQNTIFDLQSSFSGSAVRNAGIYMGNLSTNPGQLRVEIGKGQANGEGVTSLTTAIDALTAGWHHIAATHNGSSSSLYIDGVLITTGPTAAGNIKWDGADYNTNDNYIGKFARGPAFTPSSFLNGILDEAQILNSVLTAQEIATIHNNQMDNLSFWATGGIEVQ